jgi:hypothetical protein
MSFGSKVVSFQARVVPSGFEAVANALEAVANALEVVPSSETVVTFGPRDFAFARGGCRSSPGRSCSPGMEVLLTAGITRSCSIRVLPRVMLVERPGGGRARNGGRRVGRREITHQPRATASRSRAVASRSLATACRSLAVASRRSGLP